MTDLYALQNWQSVRQPQLDVCALDAPSTQFPWLEGTERARLRDRIDDYVLQRFVPWELAGCRRFASDALAGSLAMISASNHMSFS